MGHKTKLLATLLMMGCVLVAALAFIDNPPTRMTWLFRFSGIAGALLLFLFLIWLYARPDVEKDYLRMVSRNYFSCGDFCFAVTAGSYAGVGNLYVFFQSQRTGSSSARVSIRPAQGFWHTRSALPSVTVNIDAPPAAFGYARVPVPILPKFQGKTKRFDVGADVRYVSGKGQRVRFRDGVPVQWNAFFEDRLGLLISILAVLAGGFHLKSNSIAKIALPKDVMDPRPEDMNVPEVHVLWKLGDTPLSDPPQHFVGERVS